MTSTSGTGLHTNLLAALGSSIVSGQRPAGEVITLAGICEEYAVSRSVAREAVRVCESMGLVVSRRRVGITVQPREQWNVFDPLVIRWRLEGEDRANQLLSLSELRRGFEPVAAALAAERATAEQGSRLAAAVSDMMVYGRTGDLERYLVADKQFHRTLLIASGNEMFAALVPVIGEVLTGRTHHGLMPARPKQHAIDLHDDIARAVRTGDAPAAQAAMAAIIDEAAQAMATP